MMEKRYPSPRRGQSLGVRCFCFRSIQNSCQQRCSKKRYMFKCFVDALTIVATSISNILCKQNPHCQKRQLCSGTGFAMGAPGFAMGAPGLTWGAPGMFRARATPPLCGKRDPFLNSFGQFVRGVARTIHKTIIVLFPEIVRN